MPPRAAATQDNKARNRTTVGLADETIKRLDNLIAEAGKKTREALGYAVTPSRGEIVESLVKEAHDRAKSEG